MYGYSLCRNQVYPDKFKNSDSVSALGFPLVFLDPRPSSPCLCPRLYEYLIMTKPLGFHKQIFASTKDRSLFEQAKNQACECMESVRDRSVFPPVVAAFVPARG